MEREVGSFTYDFEKTWKANQCEKLLIALKIWPIKVILLVILVTELWLVIVYYEMSGLLQMVINAFLMTLVKY